MKRKRLEKKYNSRCELIGRKKGLFFFFLIIREKKSLNKEKKI